MNAPVNPNKSHRTDFLANAKPVQSNQDFLADAQPVQAAPQSQGSNWDVQASNDIGDILKGAGRGIASTAGNVGGLEHAMMPKAVQNSNYGKDFSEGLDTLKDWANPQNAWQSVGKGAEQVGEFLLPGGAEEEGAKALAKFAPWAGKAAEPLAKVLTTGASQGLVNKAQGGSFGTGAALGAGGTGIAEGLKAAAPAIAESALNIRKLDRAFGKKGGSIGRAILDETSGITPGKVAESAQGRLDELNPALNAAADRASARPNLVKALLPAPAEELPLHEQPFRRGRVSRPVVLNQADRPMPLQLEASPNETPLAIGGMDESGRFTPQGVLQRPQAFDEPSGGMGYRNYIGEIPGTQGGRKPLQGVWVRPQEIEPGQAPIAKTIANPSASLGGARGVLSHAFGTAARQGERTAATQLQPMATHLGETIGGEQIPENVTPRQLLDLKRGFGSEFIHRWNPETMTGVKGTAAKAYHAMGNEFNRTVPEGEELNRRISNLIPVAKRAESAELNAPTSQRVIGRVAAHTGALAGGIGAGAYGYHQGGVPGMIAAGALGTVAPELVASPEGQMAIARTLNSRAPKVLSKVFTGAGLTGTRQRRQTTEQ